MTLRPNLDHDMMGVLLFDAFQDTKTFPEIVTARRMAEDIEDLLNTDASFDTCIERYLERRSSFYPETFRRIVEFLVSCWKYGDELETWYNETVTLTGVDLKRALVVGP